MFAAVGALEVLTGLTGGLRSLCCLLLSLLKLRLFFLLRLPILAGARSANFQPRLYGDGQGLPPGLFAGCCR